MFTEISRSDIERARAPSPWDKGNQVLYDLCKNNPKHNDSSVIIAKIWLIGRSYSAAIERRKNATIGSDDFYENIVASAMKKPAVDKWLEILPKRMDDPWHQLGQVIITHKYLTDLFQSITGAEKRSLASKYLHFHRPDLFYLFDSRANNSIKTMVPKLGKIKMIEAKIFDQEYLNYCRRIQWLRDEIKHKYNVYLSPRELDKILMNRSKRK